MDKIALKKALGHRRYSWRRHVLERMAERGILQSEVTRILREADILESYPGRSPFPSALFMGWQGHKPVHIVAAMDVTADWVYIITVYEPDLNRFGPGFRLRKET